MAIIVMQLSIFAAVLSMSCEEFAQNLSALFFCIDKILRTGYIISIDKNPYSNVARVLCCPRAWLSEITVNLVLSSSLP